MATEDLTKVFLTISLFYTCFFLLLGFIPYDTITFTSGEDGNTTSALTPVSGYVEDTWFTPISDFFSNITGNLTGMPTFITTLIFTPIFIIGIYFLVILILKFIPLLG